MKRYNFQQVWDRIRVMAEFHKDRELLSVLQNHSENKEYICRKLGVISVNDVERLKLQYK